MTSYPLPLLSYLELGALRPRAVVNPEDFVTVALREALASAYGGRVDDQNQNYFDEARQVRLRPDIVWKIRGSAVAVIDAKYKAEKPAGYPNADLYQLLAYCTVLSLPSATWCTPKATKILCVTSCVVPVLRSSVMPLILTRSLMF